MAGDGERRMLFDIRGRRKNVVRVVYAILALLMGGSLFLTVGPFNISEIFNSASGSGSASEVFDEQVERIEGRLAKEPNDEALLLALTRARISAGNAKAEGSLEGESPQLPPDARDDYEQGLEAWNRYLKQAGADPSPVGAQLVAATFFSLSERGSNTLGEIESNAEAAVKAQRIAAEQRPNVGTLSSLAIYEYFNGNFAAGDRAAKRTVAGLPSKAEAKNVEKQLDELRKQGKEYVKTLEQFAKAQEKTGTEEPFQNPFAGPGAGTPGSLGGGSLGQ